MIAPDNIFAVLAALLIICAVSAGLEKTSFGKRISGAGFILIAAIAAAHFDIIPRSAPVYGVIWTYLVPLSIALFLLKADLIRVFNEGGRVLIAFLIGMMGTIAGTLIGAALFDLGPDEGKIAGVFSATYIGGSLNFVAVADAVGFNNASLMSAALAIDSVLGIGFIIFLNIVAGWGLLQRRFNWRIESVWGEDVGKLSANSGAKPATLFSLLSALAVAAVVVAASEWISKVLGVQDYSLLFITALMAIVATVGRKFLARLSGEDILAMIFMYLFFAIIGAGADLNGMLTAAPGMFAMVALIFAFHLIFMVAAGLIFKLNYAELIIASLACIAGPPIAAAIAILLKWRSLVAPGILTGILGYVLGNFVGVGIFSMLGG